LGVKCYAVPPFSRFGARSKRDFVLPLQINPSLVFIHIGKLDGQNWLRDSFSFFFLLLLSTGRPPFQKRKKAGRKFYLHP
jgi:hypothetical protein